MPTTNTIEKPHEIYQIKVTLLGTDPSIWRRLLVPADLTLEQLHDILQLTMGWEDCPMHEFRIGQQRFGKPDPMEQAFGRPRTASERTARLFSVLGRVGAKAVYTYDFGDRWEHQVAVEKRLPCDSLPVILAGHPDLGGLLGGYRCQLIAEFFGFSCEASDALLPIALFVCLRSFVHVRLPPSE